MTLGTSTTDPPTAGEHAYEVVSLGEGWGVLSIGFFVLSLATRPLLSFLPWEYRGWNMIPPLAVTLVPVLAALGLGCALLGKRFRGTPSRLGFLLNSVVLCLSGLLVGLVLAWRYGLG